MGGDGPLVKPDQCDQHPFHAGNTPAFRRWAAITPARTVLFIAAVRTRSEIEANGEDLEQLFFSITEGASDGGAA